MDYSFIEKNKIIPVVVINKVEDTLPTLRALAKGGINIAEITFRTACAAEAIALASFSLPEMIIGAGTVINKAQCAKAINAGAAFVVSPGFSLEVSKICKKHGIAYIPGAITPTEITNAVNEGFSILKFFPADSFGGVKTLKSLSAAFPGVSFVPTGGIDSSNMKEYLTLPFVKAIGGSFMLKGSFEEIRDKSLTATAILEGI